MNKIRFIKILVLLTVLVTPLFAFAEQQVNEDNAPGTSPDHPLVTCGNDKDGRNNVDDCDVQDAINLVKNIIKIIFIFTGFVVTGIFMYGGLLLITSGGDMNKIARAKTILRNVVVGFLIMFGAYVLVYQLLNNIEAIDFFKKIIRLKK